MRSAPLEGQSTARTGVPWPAPGGVRPNLLTEAERRIGQRGTDNGLTAAPVKRFALRSSFGCAAKLMWSAGPASARRSLVATGCGLARLVAILARGAGPGPVATAAKRARNAALSSETGFAPLRGTAAVSGTESALAE